MVVGIADLAISDDAKVVLAAYSLGSCLGVAVYDPVAHVGGVLHTMLPDSDINREKAILKPGMFVDTGVPSLLAAAASLGAEARRLRIYVVGGAQIMDGSSHFSIGRRNIEALKAVLGEQGLSIYAADVGGLPNRTLLLDMGTGVASLKVYGRTRDVPLCKSLTII
jgi:chemotaxis protein CheD